MNNEGAFLYSLDGADGQMIDYQFIREDEWLEFILKVIIVIVDENQDNTHANYLLFFVDSTRLRRFESPFFFLISNNGNNDNQK